MIIVIKNKYLRLAVDTLGAQMMELTAQSGQQYLWNGDPDYWKDRAPNLFPYVGRFTQGRYTLNGVSYNMGIHGFAASMEFDVVKQNESSVSFLLKSNTRTAEQYPFDFSFQITYTLEGNTVKICYEVENRSKSVMPFGLGGHPGFCVPFEKDTVFTDYYLRFCCPSYPSRVGHTPSCFLSGVDSPYLLEEDRVLWLKHSLFDEDAVVLKNMAREVALCCVGSARKIIVSYPQMPYLGIWHWPQKDAPYVCIEPWTSLPSRQDVVEEFLCKSDLIHLAPGGSYCNSWSITIEEE